MMRGWGGIKENNTSGEDKEGLQQKKEYKISWEQRNKEMIKKIVWNKDLQSFSYLIPRLTKQKYKAGSTSGFGRVTKSNNRQYQQDVNINSSS